MENIAINGAESSFGIVGLEMVSLGRLGIFLKCQLSNEDKMKFLTVVLALIKKYEWNNFL